jgi:hypothetical protein
VPWEGPAFFRLPEEKRTDVSIGIRMLDDAYQNSTDILVLVTGDSDLCPAVELTRRRFPEKQVVVYVPSRQDLKGDDKRKYNTELRSVATRLYTLPYHLLELAQFPDPVCSEWGQIRKPEAWKQIVPKPVKPRVLDIHGSCTWCGKSLSAIFPSD